jgi:large subunit ribosomal protein L28
MAICQICDKKSGKGMKVSHSKQRTARRFKPNLHKVKIIENGESKKITICAKCLKKRRSRN